MTVVFEDLDLPGSIGGDIQAVVDITLWGSGQPIKGRQISTGKTVGGVKNIIPDETGYWEADLVPNDDILPSGTTYRVSQVIGCEVFVSFITAPVTGGPYLVSTIEEDAMNSIATPALASHAEDVSLHAGFELASASTGTSFSVTGTSFVDIPGMSITFAVPARPYKLEFSIPVMAEDSGAYFSVELYDLADGGELIADNFRSHVAADGGRLAAFCRVPNLFHNPLPGTIVTYRLRGRRVTGTGDLTMIPDLFGARSLPTLQAIAQ